MESVFSTHDLIITIALSFIALAISGATALAIFWPLSKVHLRDKHPGWRENHLHGANEFLWFFRGGFKGIGDRDLNAFARPVQLALWTIAFGLMGGWVLWLLSEYVFV